MTDSPTPLVRRRRILLWGASGLAALSVGGVALATRIKSPRQLAAETEAPEFTLLTVPVEQRVLRKTVVFRGTITQSQSIGVSPASAWGAEKVILTGVRVKPGDVPKAGQVIAEISGRPVILLAGTVPGFRDLRPGASGKDIGQLQQALRDIGYQVKQNEGTLGPSTKNALVKLYQDIGYPVPDTGETDNRAVADARAQVEAAQTALEQAQQADPPAQAAIDAAKSALTAAKAKLAELESRTGPMLPLSEVVFVPSFPVRVVSAKTVIGGTLQGPVVVLATGDVIAAGTLTGNADQGIAVGQTAQIMVDDSSTSVPGKVSAVGADAAAIIAAGGQSNDDSNSQGGSGQGGNSGGDDGTQAGFAVVVRADSPMDAALAGKTVRLTVTVAATSAPALVVPVSAVSAGADSVETVTVVDASGGKRVVPVRVGHSGDGYVEVTPVEAGALGVGDNVLLGINPATQGTRG
ncbi:peptidoglycan-binding protein [Allorhizocola rhizosphaerae]|uniref:peptidoglycan-binding protein n=1 Tax=Allorhizocola rhizosphaerae TaxID=1872709 RepID=UPI000E3C781A|nr:peptidoglycan-binding protein [Allorhizocola rhizosphaerae]